MATPTATLLRQLFPSWEFFDVAGVPPSLEYRLLADDGSAGPWMPAVCVPVRRWWHVLFNPEGTRALAAQTLVERWHRELTELGPHAVATASSQALVNALVAARAGDRRWQLRLVVQDDEHGTAE